MAVRSEVDDIVDDTGVEELPVIHDGSSSTLRSAVKEVNRVLARTGDSLRAICAHIEGASSIEACREGFRRFNDIIRMFLVSAPVPDVEGQVIKAIRSLGPSERLESLLGSQPSVDKAITAYKTLTLKDLALALSRSNNPRVVSEEQDDDLFSRFLSQHSTEATGPRTTHARGVLSGEHIGVSDSRKRGSAHVADDSSLHVAPKKRKSKIPALASLSDLSGGDDLGGTSKKRTLLTREKLRAGMHDPRGLLDLAGPSTNALDRTKKLELLKSAGYDFNNKSKSFSDKLNAATLRLELGLGGHSINDTLLFGARVLNLPGFLSRKNTSDIENNVVNGSTTWKHQDAYTKMIIAGCLEQAKRIFEKFDEVLYGPAPEKLVEETHSSIADLLASDDAKAFMGIADSDTSAENTDKEVFIKKIIEAVAPILPVTMRNKSLDGCYLRTALHLLGVAELVFSQYIPDVRSQANPAGVVGVCTAMHTELKRSAVLSDGLRPLDEFLREMRSQYQTCLGLGESFPNDKMVRGKRRSRGDQYWKGRAWRRSGNPSDLSGRGSVTSNLHEHNPYMSSTVRGGRGRGLTASIPVRGRGDCYDFQAGTCRRGGACRFFHPS